jgi:succinate dehydrogenase / fumarate reductase cytochrome b subunit
MGTNPFIRIMEPILAIGFIVHIILATILTLRNQTMRPVKYHMQKLSHTGSWASRNMYILGATILAFLVLHIINFWVKLKFGDLGTVVYDGEEMENAYAMVASLFSMPIYSIVYIIAIIGLAYHISHGFWSAFQTIGWSNDIWRKRLTTVAYIYAIIIAVGFSIIPIYFMVK